MDNEIIIITTVTEKVTYEEMTPKERKIYDHAYRKGVSYGQMRPAAIIVALMMLFLFGFAICKAGF